MTVSFDDSEREAVNMAAAASYREAMQDLARMRKLDVWYARLDVDELEALVKSQVKGKDLKRFRKNVAKARSKDSMRAYHQAGRRSWTGVRAWSAIRR